jgi:streptomycin 6-kinase
VLDPLRSCMRSWRLQAARPLDGGFSSAVFGCVTADGAQVVVKLTATPEAARTEAAALTAWARTGATARLLDADFGQSALLLQRIRPGTPLPADDDVSNIRIAAEVLSKLHEAAPGTFSFPVLLETYLLMEQRSRDDAAYEQRSRRDPARGQAGLQRLPPARALARRLCASSRQSALLHGDFVGKNLLWNGTSYLAIDPIPAIGDPCSDAGFFAAGHPPARTTLHKAAGIAETMGLDPDRTQRWAAVWAVLQACQAWRDDQSDVEACLRTSEFERLLRE